MKDFSGTEIDTTNMTLEELTEARNKVRNMLFDIEYQIKLRKMAEHKHSSV